MAPLLFTVLCYLTNPKILPSWLTDWYHPHYEGVYASVGELAEMGRGRWYTELHDPDFTIFERIKRYICRVYWNIYIGYKLTIGADRKTRCMIANRIAFKIK